MVSPYMELALIPVEIGLELLISRILYLGLVSILVCGFSWKQSNHVSLYGILSSYGIADTEITGSIRYVFGCLLSSDHVFYSDSCGLVNKNNLSDSI